MTDKLKILVLADSRAFHTERYVTELRRQGCHVLLASLERGDMHHYLMKSRGIFDKLHYIMAATEVRAIIKRFQPDIINPHYVSGYGFTAALAGARKYAPVLLHLWGSDILIVPGKSIFHRRKIIYGLNQADFVTADSDFLIQAARQIGTVKESSIIPWGIEKRYLQYHKKNYDFSKPVKIIIPRRHEKIYNNLFIVQALEPLINSGRVSVTFPDFGSLVGHFLVNARNLVGEKLTVYEKMSREAFLEYISLHDIYLSSAISDSSPASMIEAMGLGLIPVAADIPGIREWLTPETGFAYELYNGEQLRNVITRLLDSGDNYEKLRRDNLEKVQREALFEDNVARTIEIMHRLVAARGKK
jgi:glycosyltransferase involved in cell wall biosynthesis